jgi:hypothetical protein
MFSYIFHQTRWGKKQSGWKIEGGGGLRSYFSKEEDALLKSDACIDILYPLGFSRTQVLVTLRNVQIVRKNAVPFS